MKKEQMNLNIDLKSSTPVETPEGGKIFQQGVVLRKVSKFLIGADEDALVPLPVFYDPISGKMVKETIPVELREEYKDFLI
jgi:hypothetical protein